MYIFLRLGETITMISKKKAEVKVLGNSLAVQWLALSDLTAGALGSILGWEIKIPQALRCDQKKNLKFQKTKKVTTRGNKMTKKKKANGIPNRIDKYLIYLINIVL